MSVRHAVDSFIKQLDAVYGSEGDPHPASGALVDFKVRRVIMHGGAYVDHLLPI